MKYLVSILLSLALSVGLLAQDTTRINAGDKPQYKKDASAQHQKRQRTNREVIEKVGSEELEGTVKNADGEQNQFRLQKGEMTKTQTGYMMSDEDGDGIPNGQDPDFDGAKIRGGNANGGFVDTDGDGINDKAMDDDGDGIPNGQDPDYTRPEDGSGNMHKHQHKTMTQSGSGSGNGTGDCDGTGPKGTTNKGSGKK